MTAASSAPTPSGIPAVDARWGGLHSGQSVLLMGRAGAGRTALALASVKASVDAGQTCLLLSPRAPQELTVAAGASGLDLAAMHRTGRLRVLRIPSAQDLAAKGNAGLETAYRDLAGLAAKSGATRIVIEDFTPLVQFTTFDAFGAAFDGLRTALTSGGAAFLLGLGEPANDPSRQLLDVVRSRVDATIHVTAGADGPAVSIEEREVAPAPPTPPQAPPPAAAPPPVAAAPLPATPPQAAAPHVAPEPLAAPAPAPPAPEAREWPTPQIVPEERGDASPPAPPPATAPPVMTAMLTPEPLAPEPETPAPYADPFADNALSGPPSNDGASFAVSEPSAPPPAAPRVDAPDPFGADAPQAPFGSAPPAADPFSPAAPEVPFGSPQLEEIPLGSPAPAAPSGIPRADVEPAPPPDADLLTLTHDPFGRSTGAAFFDGGYLVDSRGAKTTPVTAAHSYEAPLAQLPDPFPAPAPAPSAPQHAAPAPAPQPSVPQPAPAPSFPAVPAQPPANDAASARTALEAAYAGRAQGTPFLVVAARMQPSQPESASFATVVEGLREGLPANGTIYADPARLRSLLVIPGSDATAASRVFSNLQSYLQQRLGSQAESTLQAVAAITVPDGQPFGSAQELWAYAVES